MGSHFGKKVIKIIKIFLNLVFVYLSHLSMPWLSRQIFVVPHLSTNEKSMHHCLNRMFQKWSIISYELWRRKMDR